MNYGGTEGSDLNRPELCYIVGYGNPQRRDDGLGQYVVAGLERKFMNREGLRFLVRHQLDPDLVEELREAESVVLVDATMDSLEEGWRWTRVASQLERLPVLSHTLEPGFLVGLLGLLYGREPTTWLLAIQGDDFKLGEGLSPRAEERAHQVIAELAKFVSKED